MHANNLPMSLSTTLLHLGSKQWPSYSLPATSNFRLKIKSRTIQASVIQSVEARIKDAILKFDISPSSYDTAWVAMVPSRTSMQSPCFPECLEWIIVNQHVDGSWAHPSSPSFLKKDALLSTLACIIALKGWHVGEEHVKMGLQFIASNISSLIDESQYSPIGFDIIFPRMALRARELGLEIPVCHDELDIFLRRRELELNRCSQSNSEGCKTYLAYTIEGHENILDWNEIIKFQQTNGSLFNSPSTTAAAITRFWDFQGLNYLRTALRKFGNAVPTMYPFGIHAKLHTVDSLEKVGIDHHFVDQIKEILDEAYRCWIHNDEEIHSDLATCALAFRLLRLHGYTISSGVFAKVDEAKLFCSHRDHNLHNIDMVLELYKASQIKIFEDEKVLEKLNLWTDNFLQQMKSYVPKNEVEHFIFEEVNHALRHPYCGALDRNMHKRAIEIFKFDNIVMLKTSSLLQNVNNREILRLAIEDFNSSQSMYKDELDLLKRWITESRLDQLKFARQKVMYCYLSAAATLFPPKMSGARMSWAKNAVLTTVIDDFFDIGGSREELINFTQLVKRWNGEYRKSCCSEQVDIIFSTLYHTINELGTKASELQGRDVASHFVEIWLELIGSMMREAEWLRDGTVPALADYSANGCISIALGPIVLPALYFVGPKLPEHVIGSQEYNNLFKLVSTCGRLLNDIRGFEREGKEGKLNGVSLRVLQAEGTVSEEDAKREMRSAIESNRTQLLRLVLQREGSIVPRACKDLFWNMSKILHAFYAKNDGFTSPTEMMNAVNAVIYEPIKVPHLYSDY